MQAVHPVNPQQPDLNNLGRAVYVLRKEAGLTQAVLAEAADVQASHISNLESGRYWPSLPLLIRLAQALGITAGELLLFANRKRQ